jgi:hypothetical protein
MIGAFLAHQDASLWLLTEVSAFWSAPDASVAVSPQQPGQHEAHRLAGVQSNFPLTPLAAAGDHPGEQGLCLARAELPAGGTLLVACSVLPWRGARQWWHGLPAGSAAASAKFVLDHHLARIEEVRLPGEALVWGGDFNQELARPYSGGSVRGREQLNDALDRLRLTPATATASHLEPGVLAIDHLAVPLGWGVDRLQVHRPNDAVRLSDHAAYTADLTWRTSDPRHGVG